LDDEFLIYLLLHSLPSSNNWETFKTSVLHTLPADKPASFSEVRQRLQGEAKHVLAESTESTHAAHTSKKVCSLHGAGRHTTEECFTLKKRAKEGESARKSERGYAPKSGQKGKGKRKQKDSAHSAADQSSDSESDETAQLAIASHRTGSRVTISKRLMTDLEAYFSSEPEVRNAFTIILDSGASATM
ncbi:hypothetical protein DENSPDRAFT_752547, partial [Dentipellis sp. KUC8613]